MEGISMSIKNRQTGVYFHQYDDCNHNGQFEDSLPRHQILSDGTVVGVMSDVCQKRFVRDTIPHIANAEKNGIYVERLKFLIDKHKEAAGGKSTEGNKEVAEKGLQNMLDKHVDIRMFGAMLNCGKEGDDKEAARFMFDNVRGPIRIGYGRTIHPIQVVEESLTRVVATKPKTRKKDDSIVSVGNAEIGGTARINFGLFRSLICVNATMTQSQLTSDDVELFWKALALWPQVLHSRGRHGYIRKLFVFEHPTVLGSAQDQDLQTLVEGLTKVGNHVDSGSDIVLPTLEQVNAALAEKQKEGYMRGIKAREIVEEAYRAAEKKEAA